ncbi:AfsR/SARP family transcriptional regulator [Micromonospora wenchangensis]
MLTYTAGWPLHTHPTQEHLRQWLSDPLTEDTLIAGLVLLAWMLWLLIAALTLRTTVTRAAATIRRLRRLPLPTPMQATATGMAGAAALWAPTTTATTTDAPPALTPTSTGEHLPQTADAGVDVPGGWIPADTAHQIAAAGTLVWLRRRRLYRPPPPGQPRDDSDLTALPPTVTAVQAALADTPPTPAIPLRIPTGGIGLTGPAATDAARGILLTTLLQALRDPTRPTTVVTSRTDLHTLLGPHTLPLHDLPGLTVTNTHADAISTVTHPHHPGAAPPMLLTHAPTESDAAARLAAALTHTQGVLIGSWTHGPTWHITTDGHVGRGTGGRRTRLCVLTATAARDLLAVLTPTPTTPQAVAVPRQRPPAPTPPPEPSPPKLFTLRVLGNPTLWAAGTPVTIGRTAALQILVALSIYPDGATTHDLATMIWPGLARHTTARRLYTTLSDLRKDITATGLPHPIAHTDDRYHLHHEHTDVDLWHLNAAIDRATTALTHHSHAYQAVIDHYTGDIAANHMWPWLDPIRENIRRHMIDAHTALATNTPDPYTRLHHLQNALRLDPYNEHLHHQAADTLTALGRSQDADGLFTRYYQRLSDAGITPTS